MKFRTEIEIAPLGTKIGYENRILALGSCFAEHIAGRLAQAKFRVTARSPSPPRCAATQGRSPYDIRNWDSTANCGSITGSTALFPPRKRTKPSRR